MLNPAERAASSTVVPAGTVTGILLILSVTIFLFHFRGPPLLLADGVKAAVIHTGAALDALGLVDDQTGI